MKDLREFKGMNSESTFIIIDIARKVVYFLLEIDFKIQYNVYI